MPRAVPKFKRTPVFFPRPLFLKIDEHAKAHDVSRSDLIREAVTRGLTPAVRDLQKRKTDSARVGPTSPQTSAGPRLPRASGPLTLEQAVPQLCSHIESFRATGRSVSDEALRDVLEVYAMSLNIAPDDFDDAVAEAYGRLCTEDDGEPSLVGLPDPHQPPR